MKEKLKFLYIKEIKPEGEYFFLSGCVLLFALLRIPSLVEPDWYGDEGIYQVIGRALVSGRLLYRDIWDNKPPVLYLYYALTNGDLFYIRLLSLLFGIGAIIVFFLVAKSLFQNRKAPVFISTLLFSVLFGLPLLEGNIANAENFMLFPTLLSLYLILKLTSKSSYIFPAAAGLLLSLAFLTKIVAVFDLGAFLLILFFIQFYKKSIFEIKNLIFSKPKQFIYSIRHELVICAFFFIPVLLTVLFFLVTGAISDFIKASFSQNVGYVGYGNYFLFPQGFLVAKLLILIFLVGLVWKFRKKIGISEMVIYLWLLFSLFNAFFSGRPYTHYVLVMLPAFCLVLGSIFMEKKMAFLNCVIVIVLVLLIKYNFSYYSKDIAYYKNYINFVFNKKSITDYQSFFDSNTPKDYEIAQFINANTKKNEGILLVSDSSTIYYLSNKLPPGRYIVAYHITFYKNGIEETEKAVEKVKPKYIISSDDSLSSNFIQNYEKKYILDGTTVYERQY